MSNARAITLAFLATLVLSASALAQQEDPAKTLYGENCKKCHGVKGTPPKAMKTKFPKIATFDAEFFAKRSDDSVVKVLTKGKNEDMESFKDKMTAEQMMLVAKYIRGMAAK